VNPDRSGTDLLQTSTAIAAIAIALATLTEGRGPAIGSLDLFATSLLLGGFFAVASSLYAMYDVIASQPSGLTSALGLLTVALVIVGITYIVMLYDVVNW
jgi:hypothetical protein